MNATSATARATRAALKAWGLEAQCQEQGAHSPALTAVRMPEGHDADYFRKIVLENFDMSLGTGLNKVKGKVFRIGHIGHFNDLMLMGTLSGVEMGLDLAKVPASQRRRDRGDGCSERTERTCRWRKPPSPKFNKLSQRKYRKSVQ